MIKSRRVTIKNNDIDDEKPDAERTWLLAAPFTTGLERLARVGTTPAAAEGPALFLVGLEGRKCQFTFDTIDP